MGYRTILEDLRTAAASMDLAAEAGEAGDWDRVEQRLLDVHERNARLLRDIGLNMLKDFVPDCPREAA